MNKMMWMVAASVVGSLAATGCGKKKTCEAIFNMESKCSKGADKFAGKKDEFVTMCTKAFEAATGDEKSDADQMASCASKSTCEEYKACGDAADGKRRAKKVAKKMAEGKLQDAWSTCTISARYYSDASFKAECAKVFKADRSKLSADDLQSMGFSCRVDKEMIAAAPELAAACKEMTTGQLTALTAAAIKVRDTGSDSYKECSQLEMAAEDAGDQPKADAKVLCDEISASRDVHKALTDIGAAVAAKKTDAPYQCSSTPGDLQKLGSPWAKTALDQLVKACFVDLGLVTFAVEATPEETKYGCPYKVSEVLKADTKYGLSAKYPEFAAAKAKLPAKCLAEATP